jgi:hypothetical protein
MPTTTDSRSPLASSRSSSFFSYPVTYAVSGILRRLSSEPSNTNDNNHHQGDRKGAKYGTTSSSQSLQSIDSSMEGVFTPPRRKLSPFQPPPLTPLTLKGWRPSTSESAKLLTKGLAEEIRLLVPPRLQLVDEWRLTFSLAQNGVSLATLYEKAEEYRGKRGGYVLVVQDGSGGVCHTNTSTILTFQPNRSTN